MTYLEIEAMNVVRHAFFPNAEIIQTSMIVETYANAINE